MRHNLEIKYDSATGIFSKFGKRYEWLDKRSGYVRTKFQGRIVLAHRVAYYVMTGNWPASHIDHINGNRSDNRWQNLRLATRAQNNRHRRCYSKSGFKGVEKDKDSSRWRARIKIDGRSQHLGSFASAELAARAYDKAASSAFGEFAKLNFNHD